MAAVASRNYFNALADDPIPEVTPKADETPKAETPASRGGQRGRTGPASRGGRYYQRGGGAASGPREATEGDEAPRESKRSGDDRGRGRGRGGRGRGERGRGGHGRVFDKHSATGKTDTEKKINQGWGADEGDKEREAEEEGSKDAAQEVPADDPWGVATVNAADDAWGPAVDAPGDATKEAAAPEPRHREEEEDNTLTLDQYLAQQKEKTTVPRLEGVRQANDGDDEFFKGATPVNKGDEEDAYFAPKAKAVKARAKKTHKQVIEIDGQFSDRVQRGGRGGRGGERGTRGGRSRGGRGRGRGDFQGGSNEPVSVNDPTAFPSLS